MEKIFAIRGILEAAGIYLFPLGLCSFFMMFIIFERLIALRSKYILPDSFLEKMLDGDIDNIKSDEKTVAGRILKFYRKHPSDRSAVNAFVELEVLRMERGLFLLEIVIAAAPLIGLLGTVDGLIGVFHVISPTSGTPDSQVLMHGIALALSSTMIGLLIAIPAIAGNSYLLRKIDVLASQLNVAIERMIDISENKHSS
jgi:biopolymer transport protein ExbB